MLEGIGPAPKTGASGAQREPLPAQGRGVVGQSGEQQRRCRARRPQPGQAAHARKCMFAHRGRRIRQPAPQDLKRRTPADRLDPERHGARATRRCLRLAAAGSIAARRRSSSETTSASASTAHLSTGSKLGAASGFPISLRIVPRISGLVESRWFRPIACRTASRPSGELSSADRRAAIRRGSVSAPRGSRLVETSARAALTNPGIRIREVFQQSQLKPWGFRLFHHSEERGELERLGARSRRQGHLEKPPNNGLEHPGIGVIEEAELTVVADVDHRLGLPGVESSLEECSVKGVEHGTDLALIAGLQRRHDGREQHGCSNSRRASRMRGRIAGGSCSMFF